MQPVADVILIKVDPAKKQTDSGILLQEDWKTLPPVGEVLAIGPAVKAVQVGQKVLFERYASVILGKDERLCKESHILAIIKDGA